MKAIYVTKVKIAHLEQFSFCHNVFRRSSAAQQSKSVLMWEKGLRQINSKNDHCIKHTFSTQDLIPGYNPFPHTTILKQTSLNIFCQKMGNLSRLLQKHQKASI